MKSRTVIDCLSNRVIVEWPITYPSNLRDGIRGVGGLVCSFGSVGSDITNLGTPIQYNKRQQYSVKGTSEDVSK